jgi:hypothetical protein
MKEVHLVFDTNDVDHQRIVGVFSNKLEALQFANQYKLEYMLRAQCAGRPVDECYVDRRSYSVPYHFIPKL